jgi:hypothetical protein
MDFNLADSVIETVIENINKKYITLLERECMIRSLQEKYYNVIKDELDHVKSMPLKIIQNQFNRAALKSDIFPSIDSSLARIKIQLFLKEVREYAMQEFTRELYYASKWRYKMMFYVLIHDIVTGRFIIN